MLWSIVFALILQWNPVVIMSGSMMPNVRVGDVAIAQPIDAQNDYKMLELGQVLLVEDPADPERLVTHRIFDVVYEPDGGIIGYITKGDANPEPDSSMIPLSNVKGLQRVLIPFIGLPVQGLQTGNFVPLGVAFALVLFSIHMVRKAYEDAGKDDSDNTDGSLDGNMATKEQDGIRASWGKKLKIPVLSLIALSVIVSSTGSSSATFSGVMPNKGSTFTAGTWSSGSVLEPILDPIIKPITGGL